MDGKKCLCQNSVRGISVGTWIVARLVAQFLTLCHSELWGTKGSATYGGLRLNLRRQKPQFAAHDTFVHSGPTRFRRICDQHRGNMCRFPRKSEILIETLKSLLIKHLENISAYRSFPLVDPIISCNVYTRLIQCISLYMCQ